MSEFDAGGPVADHPSSEALANYLNGKLAEADGAAIESHLSECRSCRRQVVKARELLTTYPARRGRRLLPVLAAAAILLLVAPRLMRRDPPTDIMRSASDTPARLTVLSPPNNSTVGGDSVTFVWRNVPGRPLFRLTLAEDGRMLWSAETRDTIAGVPDTVSLRRGASYIWYVDALGEDGRSLTTGIMRFSVTP